MKKITLTGKVVLGRGKGDATYRMQQLTDIFIRKIPCFRKFSNVGGTLNIELAQAYPKKTIREEGIIRFESREIPKRTNRNDKPYPNEGFTFIPVYKIQGEEIDAYIYSPDGTCNPDEVIEIIAKFKIRQKYDLKDGDRITIETLCDK